MTDIFDINIETETVIVQNNQNITDLHLEVY